MVDYSGDFSECNFKSFPPTLFQPDYRYARINQMEKETQRIPLTAPHSCRPVPDLPTPDLENLHVSESDLSHVTTTYQHCCPANFLSYQKSTDRKGWSKESPVSTAIKQRRIIMCQTSNKHERLVHFLQDSDLIFRSLKTELLGKLRPG